MMGVRAPRRRAVIAVRHSPLDVAAAQRGRAGGSRALATNSAPLLPLLASATCCVSLLLLLFGRLD